MGRRRLEVADIVRSHRDDFVASRKGRITSVEQGVLRAIVDCRTQALGGHVDRCDRCGHEVISYNSCRNRHCPKCQASAGAAWSEAREDELLPVEYFHVVFTVPREIAAIALQNKAAVYDILMRSAAETLQAIAADAKHLGAAIGVLAVLHTWGQTLEHHPHVHCVVPGGGIAADRLRWLACRPGFFLPVRVLGKLFRGKFLNQLRGLHKKGELSFYGSLLALESPETFRAYLKPLYETRWVVYAKPPFGGPAQVLKYLSRYTHRVAISNSRLVSLDEGQVSFMWKDYAHGCRRKVMTLGACEFLRRFLLHILPKGFVKIRSYGFLANSRRKRSLALCRRLLDAERSVCAAEAKGVSAGEDRSSGVQCPDCKQGRMMIVSTFEAGDVDAGVRLASAPDTS